MKSNPIFKFALLRSASKSPHNQQGFTLIEVIVAVLVLSIFILAAMSALVIGLNGKLKAKLNNEATLIIEQQLESDRHTSTFGFAAVSGIPTVGTISGTSIPLLIPIKSTKLYTGGSAAGTSLTLQLNIGFEKSAYTLTSVPSATSTSVAVTLNASKITAPATTLKTALTASSITSIATETDATSRIKVDDRIVIGPSSGGTNLFTVIVTGITPTTISFASFTTANAYPAATPITVLPRSGDIILDPSICPDATTTPVTTIASKFISFIPNLAASTVPTFNGRSTYKLTRTATAAPAPTSADSAALSTTVVQLVYSVTDTTVSSTPLATLTTQVIPNVASQCP